MRVALDPIPLVLGIYAHVGKLLARAREHHEDDDAAALGRRYARGAQGSSDRDVQKLVRTLHSDVKTADKLLKKTSNVWKISRETDLVNLVVLGRGEEPAPSAYVLVKVEDVRDLLACIRDAAEAAGESEGALEEIDDAASSLKGKPSDYVTFGFDPWGD